MNGVVIKLKPRVDFIAFHCAGMFEHYFSRCGRLPAGECHLWFTGGCRVDWGGLHMCQTLAPLPYPLSTLAQGLESTE